MSSEYILAIDSSLSSTGYAIINFYTEDVILTGRIETDDKDTEDNRMIYISNKLKTFCKLYNIEYSIMESQYYTVNAKTAMQLSRLRGAIMYSLRSNNIFIEYMLPTEIRKILLNKGNAKKEEVAKKIQEIYKDNPNVNLGEFNDKSNKKKNSDMYDAISIGVSYIRKKKNEGWTL